MRPGDECTAQCFKQSQGQDKLNGLAATFLTLCGAAVLLVRRQHALIALLVGVCYIPAYVGVEIGGFNFTAIRVLIAVGLIRVLVRSERPVGPMTHIDRAMSAWAIWLVLSSLFRDNVVSALVFRLGLVYDAVGIYVLVRAHCRTVEDAVALARAAAIVLAPLALAMLYEQANNYNLFSLLGGVGEHPIVREGRVRANGPFGHPILAGTVGAVCLPIMVGLWKTHPGRAKLGVLACVTIVLCSASSGPILSAVAGMFGIYLWRYRSRMRMIQKLAIAGYVLLELIMKDPAYFIIARVDLAGGSTSWYRARLIQSALEHLPEWWLAGTEYTRHWMWVVVSWSPNHTDITSHYIQLGVWGGLPLMLLFILVLWRGFAGVAEVVRCNTLLLPHLGYQIWALGAMLFALAVTGLSVSYFDQSFVFIYVALGSIGSAVSHIRCTTAAQPAIARASTVAPVAGSTPLPRRAGDSW